MSERTPPSETSEKRRSYGIDSSWLVAFEKGHGALKAGLKRASSLSMTQYRMLVKLLGASPNGIAQSDLAALLNLKANVITQALNVLEEQGFVERRKSPAGDLRVKTAFITDAGIDHVSKANDSIVEQLYALFPTENATYRQLLEASIAAGARIDPPLSPLVSQHYAGSRTLVSFELIRKALEEALQNALGASLNESRILLRLEEAGDPLRVGDLADQLQMTAVAVARATDRLVDRGWATRLASPSDRKAVFVATTPDGRKAESAIDATIAQLAEEYLWSKLSDQQCRAVARVGRVMEEDRLARKEAERKAELDLLEPLP